MTLSIEGLSISDIEDSFGLKTGDLKLVSSTDSLPYILKNGWSELEGYPLRATRLELINETWQNKIVRWIINLGPSIFEFAPGGKYYEEHGVYGLWRLWNFHVKYEVIAYVNENCRLFSPVANPITGSSGVEKMTDLFLATLHNEKRKEGEICAYHVEGPMKGKYENYIGEGNIGKFLVGFRNIDMEQEVSCTAPKWLKERNEKNRA